MMAAARVLSLRRAVKGRSNTGALFINQNVVWMSYEVAGRVTAHELKVEEYIVQLLVEVRQDTSAAGGRPAG